MFFFLISLLNFRGQTLLRGKVTDKNTGKPVPFASVYALKNKIYTATSLEGTFELSLKKLPDSLKISYLGYETSYVFVTKNHSKIIDIQLSPKEVKLQEVVIDTDYDPLTEFLKKVIKNAPKHNPKNYTYYKYVSYNKLRASVNDSDVVKELPYIFIWEIVTEKIHKAPDNDHEKVLATRMSGLKKAVFPISPTDFQSLSFYEPSFGLLGYSFISPVGKNALKFYYYEDIDTLFQADGDSVFIIKFYPKKINANLFKGQMRISAKELALLSIDAEALFPVESKFFRNIRIKQLHRSIKGFWFPEQLSTDFIMNLPAEDTEGNPIRLLTTIETLFREIDISDTFPKAEIKRIPPYKIEVSDKALKRDSAFWETFRPYDLDKDEEKCYRVLDSAVAADPVGRARIYFILNQTRKLPYGLLQIGKFDINLKRLARYNLKEGLRLGLGILTNEKLSQVFTLGGYFGYGFKDERSKYGGILSLSPLRNKSIRWQFLYENDVREFGVFHIYPASKFLLFQTHLYGRDLETREFRADRYIYYRKLEGKFFFPVRRSWEFASGVERWFCGDSLLSGVFDFITAEFRWAIGQKLMKQQGQIFMSQKGNPVFTGKFLGTPQGEYRIDVGVYAKVPIKHNWYYSGFLRSGYIRFNNPFFFHSFASAGRNASGSVNTVYADYSFQTMPYNRFLATEYASLFNIVGWENLSFPNKKYNPDIMLHLNIGNGILRQSVQGYEDFGRGFYLEGGITLAHIFPEPFSMLGISLFYPMSSEYFDLKDWQRNFIAKIFVSGFGK